MARIDNLTNFLTDVADSIRSKTGKSETIACEDFDTEIESIETGGGSIGELTVDFYDFDGTMLYQYTLDQIKKLSTLPTVPTHTGLVFKGWNWSLEDLKEITEPIDVGALYDTTDGSAKIYVSVPSFLVGATTFINLAKGEAPNTDKYTVDWGDGSGVQSGTLTYTWGGFTSHIYNEPGDYVITIDNPDGIEHGLSIIGGYAGNGSYTFSRMFSKFAGTSFSSSTYMQDRPWWSSVRKVFIGSHFSNNYPGIFGQTYNMSQYTLPAHGYGQITNGSFGLNYSLQNIIIPPVSKQGLTADIFRECYGVKSISFPKTWQPTQLALYAFYNCSSLEKIILPDSITTMSGNYVFANCSALSYIHLPINLTNISMYAFQNCSNLVNITIPDTVQTIGNYAFQSCRRLVAITIPSSVTTIGSGAFQNCYALQSVTLSPGVTTIGSYAFNKCYALKSITIPSTVTTIGNVAFSACSTLEEVVINAPITNIPQNCFAQINSLQTIKIPSTVTNIEANAFYSSYISVYDFSNLTQIPTLANTNAFSTSCMSSDTKIVVPDELYEDWIVATNWSTYANYIVKASEV